MKTAYTRIGWGLLLTMIDFRINNLDLLPDAIGYLLVLVGLSRMKEGLRYFKIARWSAIVLLLLSLVQLTGLESTVSLTSGEKPGFRTLAITSITVAIELAMLYGICRGIRSSATNRRKLALAESAKNGWAILFVFGAISLFALPFQLNYPFGEGLGLLLLVTVGYFLCGLWVIFLVRRAGRELPGARKGGGDPPEDGVGGKLDVIV